MKQSLSLFLAAVICVGVPAHATAGACGVTASYASWSFLHEIRFKIGSDGSGGFMPALANGDKILVGYWGQVTPAGPSLAPPGGTLGACVRRASGVIQFYYAFDVTSNVRITAQLTDSAINLGGASSDFFVVNPSNTSGATYAGWLRCNPSSPLTHPSLEAWRYNGYDLHVFGDGGADEMEGGLGIDWFCGAAGQDDLYGGWESDWLSGWTSGDLLAGGPGDDVNWAGDGDDILYSDANYDSFGAWDFSNGEAGNDCIEDQSGHNSISGGDGYDYCVYLDGYYPPGTCDSRRPTYFCTSYPRSL